MTLSDNNIKIIQNNTKDNLKGKNELAFKFAGYHFNFTSTIIYLIY